MSMPQFKKLKKWIKAFQKQHGRTPTFAELKKVLTGR